MLLAVSVDETNNNNETKNVSIVDIDREEEIKFLELMKKKDKVLKGLKDYDRQTERRNKMGRY